jgi:GNAT superfamily N-acetyltransferase
MNRESLAAFLTIFLRAADFVIRAVDEDHAWAVDWLPFCAAYGYLHPIRENGQVTGAAIAGPISSASLLSKRRPGEILPAEFEPAGDVLFGAYLFVDPALRGRGLGLERFAALVREARSKWPGCTRYAYCRRGRLIVRPFGEGEPSAPAPQIEEEELAHGIQ